MEEVNPHSLDHSIATLAIGEIALIRGDLETARKHIERSLELRAAVSPNSVHLAEAYRYRGQLNFADGQYEAARHDFTTALEIQSKINPSNAMQATNYFWLGKLDLLNGSVDKAISRFEQAIGALEAQTQRLGGMDRSRAQFSSRYSNFFKTYMDLLVEEKDVNRAFDVLERYRARTFMALLTEQDAQQVTLISTTGNRSDEATADYENARQNLLTLVADGASADRIRAAQDRLIEARIRFDAPKTVPNAQLKRHRRELERTPLTLGEIQELLPEELTALSYAVGADRTTLFVVDRNSISAHVVPITAAELATKVRRFVHLIDAGRHVSEPSTALLDAGSELYDLLLAS